MTVITQPYPDWLKFSWSLHNYVLHLLTSQSHLLILEYWNYNTPYISISLSFWSSFNLKIRSFDQWAHLLVFCVCLAMLVRCCWYWSGIVSSICVVVTVVWLSETLRYSQRERERERERELPANLSVLVANSLPSTAQLGPALQITSLQFSTF